MESTSTFKRGAACQHAANRFNATASPQTQIDQGNIRNRAQHQGICFVGTGCFTYDLQARLGVEQAAVARSYDGVVIDQNDPDHVFSSCSCKLMGSVI
jgi:hypothetical protein